MSMSEYRESHSSTREKKLKNPESKNNSGTPRSDLWTDGLICAFEFVRGTRKNTGGKSVSTLPSKKLDRPLGVSSSPGTGDGQFFDSSAIDDLRERAVSSHGHKDGQGFQPGKLESFEGSRWVPIGWSRISELVQTVQVNSEWPLQSTELMDDEEDVPVADLAAPYWERPGGPTWWCHVVAGHPSVDSWLRNAQWLHPAISLALRDESKLISERMKHLLYEVPVRVAGGLLFELLGQSAGDPSVNEDDVPVVLRSWQAKNFLITVMHIKGNVSNINVLGITEVQELLYAGGYNVPRTVHEVIAHLACRLTRWDDRLFRKSIFGEADEIELKFVNRRNHEDLNLFSIILNQEIRKLSRQVIRVKWSLHAREEIIFELLLHLRGSVARYLLESVRKSTREMMEEQEAVRGRLFTIQDVMQSNVRAWLQDKSLRVNHNLAVFGGCGLVLTIITGLFGINVDGIPGSQNAPYAFGLFSGIMVFVGAVLIVVGLVYLGLKKPVTEEQVEVRKLELQDLVKMFQHEAETHAQVRRNNLSPTAGDVLDADYVLIQ
ncbi:PREDICTED: uncharacterized protein LOC104820634 [Tarenaya hassleriana]|uniref:uncharacterized protein LOC104820634 n=1 Tax=Tarenaya hassleriana TaxID=28532 RepID=UPI00053C7158|nr:PREDICTED: uncharacterized protein LOC104820634 [Tarenaya hassleriana]XP_010549463.1 PREDICTED: uncharacterized protein LOC104820634 [Tarenaya hassleriana]XP_010549464.1 PREDICTED: uncharacterized protein LOC104820634 [Tarenaya hassleriana]XP_010549466.1 PREDICTED: uncharacterized protein LOC104820634 [Tarenaya hassleriana]XP_010549467.1 PREDICTED: uncharacterized protein LOC104820634 [Tarenaya hassleriana]